VPGGRSERQNEADDQRITGAQFSTLLADLAMLANNRVRLPGSQVEFDVLTQPTQLQKRVFDRRDLQAQL